MTPALPTPGELLPHGAGMMLLDEVLHIDEDGAECLVRISPQSRFFEPGHGVPNWVGIEYMAQTIGVHAGQMRRQRGLPVEIGLLLGSRALEYAKAYFADGECLRISVQLAVRDGEGVGAYECRMTSDGQVCARALIKAYQPDNIRGFLDRIYENRP